MSYKVEVTSVFERQLKRLVKKYPSLKSEFTQFVLSVKDNPFQGKKLSSYSFKVRIAIASKGKGKSGGARIITYVQVKNEKVYLLSIYDKSEQSDISDKDLINWIKELE